MPNESPKEIKMNAQTQALSNAIEGRHDWSIGQTHGGFGTRLHRTDICRICKLERQWFSDRINGVENECFVFADESKRELCFEQAAHREFSDRATAIVQQAGPELLAALQEAYRAISILAGTADNPHVAENAIRMAEAAIRNATKETPSPIAAV
jgi:hypothetical protein